MFILVPLNVRVHPVLKSFPLLLLNQGWSFSHNSLMLCLFWTLLHLLQLQWSYSLLLNQQTINSIEFSILLRPPSKWLKNIICFSQVQTWLNNLIIFIGHVSSLQVTQKSLTISSNKYFIGVTSNLGMHDLSSVLPTCLGWKTHKLLHMWQWRTL